MSPQKELKLAYGLAIVLLIVGVIGYAAAPAKTPDKPIRIMYKTVAGKVLFDHKTHIAESGYSLACKDCHHHPEGSEDEGEEAEIQPCNYCHQALAEGETFPKTCLDCHEAEELEDTEISNRPDAFHSQCEKCHKESGAGPEENRCSWCHVS
ncbi:MAG: cytochrome c3 family protein [Desulfobacterales bacterium]|uniref:Cytochrome c3 family protein n=1 Tax=Candidatus Desulfatibia profunda TaxID=2841695 RepID=A0A8J6NJE7_9BACT|nr:cytochrome c3 family protein [Candidatus Desulfatibia profunda]MBL7178720.1 cytochrome c3 family protein [Desulfobacterales bacterium]